LPERLRLVAPAARNNGGEARLVHDHAPDALALMHQVESLVDVAQGHRVSDHRIDLDLALHVPVDDPGDIGAPARAAKRSALPDPPRAQREGPGRNLLAGTGDPDDHAHAPAAVA